MDNIKLNKEQFEAINNTDNACIVKASVGSGKTTVLIHKILKITETIDINKVVILTFTNKAACEIKDRLKEKNINEAKYCGTFHSIALNLLQNNLNVESLGYTKNFTVVDPAEESYIAENIIEEKKLKIKYKNRLIKRIEEGKNNINKYDDDILELCKLIKEEKIKQDKMTFDDLIINANILLKDNTLDIKYIIVDEFQDSSLDQLTFIDSLKNSSTKLFVVGDENQIIYSFRSSNKEVFNLFKERYNATILSLPLNYRSSKGILDLANSIIGKSNIIGTRNLNSKIKVINLYDSFSEATYVADRIKEINDYSSIAILYRTQKQSNIFCDIFNKYNIPYEVSLKKTINDIPVLCWFISLLKVSLNNNDTVNLMKVFTDSYYGYYTKASFKKKLIKKDDELLLKIIDFKNNKYSNIIDIINYYNLDKYLKPTSVTFDNDKKLIDTFISKIEVKDNVIDSIREFLNMSSLYGMNILNEEIDSNTNTVKLMTLHASKGLEFKHVFIVGTNEGLIPIRTRDQDEYNEEKRLFFVGITRAKDELTISYLTNPDEQRVLGERTSFLYNVPSELIESNEVHSLQKAMDEIRKTLREEKKIERLVYHKKYGKGKVIAETEDIITIDFEKYGEKDLMKDFEVLENVS